MSKFSFSRKTGTYIGSFEYGLGLVDIRMSDEAVAISRDPPLIDRYKSDPSRQLKYLLEATAYLHERRHYLDTFGTVSGLSVYLGRLACMRRFMNVSLELRQRRQYWQLPLGRWVSSKDCPEPVRQMWRFARSHLLSAEIFFGHFDPVALDGHTSEAWVDVPIAGEEWEDEYVAPAFPFSLGMKTSTEPEEDSVRPVTVLYPLGFEALLEGAAHSMARGMVESLFPTVDPSLLVQYGAPARLQMEDDGDVNMQHVAEIVHPYNVTDFLISKYLRKRGVTSFPRDLVLKLTDIGLSQGSLTLTDSPNQATRLEMVNPAFGLIRALTSAPVNELKAGVVRYPARIDAGYAAWLKSLAQGGDWDTVENHNSIYRATNVWESFLAQKVIRPLLQKRLDSAHACYHNSMKNLPLLFDDELPGVHTLNGRLKFVKIPQLVKNAWVDQMMLGEISSQAFSDSEIILCPRAHDLVPGLRSIDLSGGHCDRNMKRGCGSWKPGQQQHLPNCAFTQSLSSYGFIPITPVS